MRRLLGEDDALVKQLAVGLLADGRLDLRTELLERLDTPRLLDALPR
jgi:hypothetical protein